MTVRASVGTLLAISAGAPATNDAAGFAALSWTTIGEITNVGELAQQWGMAEHTPVDTGRVEKYKTTRNAGSQTFELGLDTDDAGQILAKAAMLATGNYSFRQTMPNGDIYYSRGLVTNFSSTPGDAGAITNASMTIERNFAGANAWVEALAA